MLLLITYDVNIEDGGKTRLAKVAKTCEKYGVRVQNSTFECLIDNGQYLKFKNELIKIIDTKKDSLRFYNLGNNYANRVEHVGAKPAVNMDELLVF